MDQEPPIISRARQELRMRRGIAGYLQTILDVRHAAATFRTFGQPRPLWKRGMVDDLDPVEVAHAYRAIVLSSRNRMDWDLVESYLQLTSLERVPRVDVMPAELAQQVSVSHEDVTLENAPSLQVTESSLIVSTKWNGTTTINYGNRGWLYLAIDRARSSLHRYRYQPDTDPSLVSDVHAWELVAFRQDFSRLPASAPMLVMAAPSDLTIQLHASNAASGSDAGVVIRMGSRSARELLNALGATDSPVSH